MGVAERSKWSMCTFIEERLGVNVNARANYDSTMDRLERARKPVRSDYITCGTT